VKKPDIKNSKGMILCGAFATEAVDSSGEIVKIDGIDISSLEEGQGTANSEHVSLTDGMGKETVGKIIYVHKIYKKSDCEDEMQEKIFEMARNKPLLFGMVRLFDAAGHHEAQDYAAQIRDYEAHKEQCLVRFSIEGSTVEKELNIVKQSIARRVAMTIQPCNKTAISKLVLDPSAPEGYRKVDNTNMLKTEMMQDPQYRKIGGSVALEVFVASDKPDPLVRLVKNTIVLGVLNKALTAGSGDIASSNKTGGAALQKEDVGRYKGTILAAIRDYDQPWSRQKFKKHLQESLSKASLPPMSEEFINHFTNVAEDVKLKKSKFDPYVKSLFKTQRLLEEALIDLRKSVRDVVENNTPNLPQVYKVTMDKDGYQMPVGRFVIFNNKLHHLEDYHNILNSFLPEGPIDATTILKIHGMEMFDVFKIDEHLLPKDKKPPKINIVTVNAPERPAVFSYFRPGMAQAHTVEFTDNGAALDGKKLTEDELNLMVENANKGLAKITWHNGDLIKKEEDVLSEDELEQSIKKAFGEGSPQYRAFAQHMYHDDMVKGVGNKKAATNFLVKNKPGVYLALDGNDFKEINNKFGHTVGDQAIASMGGALRDASAKVGTTKVFRNGGDEFMVHAPTHEDAATFLGHLKQHMDALPLVGGQHKQSFSVGMGHDFKTADAASYLAKDQKLDPISKQRAYAVGQVPNLGHSLLPGHEGPIFKEETKPHPAAVETKLPSVEHS
jgi:diguanylate cyclase (GGDEF)-like protein